MLYCIQRRETSFKHILYNVDPKVSHGQNMATICDIPCITPAWSLPGFLMDALLRNKRPRGHEAQLR